MNHPTPVLPGHHGVRALAEIAEDKDGWLAFCQHCSNNDQESVIASGVPTKTGVLVKAEEHEYRHAGCDPLHILHILRIYGGAEQELPVPEINRRLFGSEEDYSGWLLRQMEARSLVTHREYRGIRYCQRVIHAEEHTHA